ncbi:MAG TPA: hypothetical protein VNS55_08075 [Nocardioides sp.]|nr:hypothetical protein [Nocardioides sp.]
MWENIRTNDQQHLSHDLPCQGCGHTVHTYLPCSDTCSCSVKVIPGMVVAA